MVCRALPAGCPTPSADGSDEVAGCVKSGQAYGIVKDGRAEDEHFRLSLPVHEAVHSLVLPQALLG
jgi:hypothetical protein